MGCGFSFVCKTCQNVYLLGYGSYGTWFIFPKSVGEYEQIADQRPKQAQLRRNQNIKTCLIEHARHDFEYLYHGTEDLKELVPNPEEYRQIEMDDV